MGLDMYLYRQRDGEPTVEAQFDEFERSASDNWIAEYEALKARCEVAYWRKANAIHRWFVETCQGGVDDCQWSDPIGREALAGLVERCRAVLDGQRDGREALPTQAGFFFGDTEYDEGYEADLKETIAQLEPLLAERNSDVFIYRSSW